MDVFLEGLTQFKILMELLRNYFQRIIPTQMEPQYKNENLHSIADVLRGTFTLFDVAFHSAETHLGGAGTKIIQKYADVCRFFFRRTAGQA